MTSSVSKFDHARASEYVEQSRIALAGYEACHELAACLLSSVLGRGSNAELLVVGAGGTAQEIQVAGRLEPRWRFVAIDPSQPMLASAQTAIEAAGLSARTEWHLGLVEHMADRKPFDAALLIGVLHHLPGQAAKRSLLRSIASRLKPDAPMILACNRGTYANSSLFLHAWATRWRMTGAADDEVQAKISNILHGADPLASDEEVMNLLELAGFKAPELFFSSLFWGAWIARHDDCGTHAADDSTQ